MSPVIVAAVLAEADGVFAVVLPLHAANAKVRPVTAANAAIVRFFIEFPFFDLDARSGAAAGRECDSQDFNV
jgi:hypothetical protein